LGGLERETLPTRQLARRTRAWITMGALPPGASLRAALLAYDNSEVVGFYDTLSHRLVYSGTKDPTPYQRYVLSHELTHALDDRGGESAVDAAFRNPPVSTEQILHPGTYPSDRPDPVTVSKPHGLDGGWTLIDQMEVGEAWLELMLQLKLPESQDAEATDF